MISDNFGMLLEELSQALKIEKLTPDSHNTCLVRFKNGISIQLEPDKDGTSLLIGTQFITVPPGRYRENVYYEALRANGLPPPRLGILAYSKQADALVMFERLPLKDLTGQKLSDFLQGFLTKALVWQESLTRGEIPTIENTYATARQGGGMFGL